MIEIVSRDGCCGCEACAQACPMHCIEMVEDEEGFLFPNVDFARCVKCKRCENVCPVVCRTSKRDPIAGYAYRTKDDELLKKTSSGGFFTAVAERVLANGGVVFGAAFNAKNEVVHTYVETLDELDSLRRSKYVQSRIGSSFSDCQRFLEYGREVIFCGTPCQVKALSLFLGKKYGNLVLVDFVCHGVPSPSVFKNYLKEICIGYHEKEIDIRDINFREKVAGFAYSFSFATERRKYVENPGKNIFLKGFLSDLYLRRSCHSCPAKNFTSGADYTMCDFWNIERVLPSFPTSYISGTSQVFVVNDKLNIFGTNEASAITAPFDLTNQNGRQKWLSQSVPITTKRAAFFSYLREGQTIKESVLALSRRPLMQQIFHTLRSLLSLIYRTIRTK